MGKKKSKPKTGTSTIALNKKARHDFFIEERFEAGLELQGWEVKSLRDSRVQLSESYIIIKNSEAWLLGVHISPMTSASTHITPDPTRRELDKLIGAVERKGYTIVPLALYWKKGRAKLEVALARGKQSHDKRATEKERDWGREKQRLLRGR
jgi:SsrA-binding protein